MNIIQKAHTVTKTEHVLCFVDKNDPNCGFEFPCTEKGEPLTDLLNETAQENLRKCQLGVENVLPGQVETRTSRWREPNIGRCRCGGVLTLSAFTNACRCGRNYNWAGQELAPKGQWGEETGEHPADILRIR